MCTDGGDTEGIRAKKGEGNCLVPAPRRKEHKNTSRKWPQRELKAKINGEPESEKNQERVEMERGDVGGVGVGGRKGLSLRHRSKKKDQ